MANQPKPITCSFYDFVSGDYRGTMPINGKRFADALNVSATMSGSVPIVASDPEIDALDPWDLTVPGKGVVVFDIGGSIIGTYLITGRERAMSPQGISITGDSLPTWLAQRVQATDYSNPPYSGISPSSPMTYWTDQGMSPYQGADPTLIAAQLISDMLGNYFYDTVATGLDVLGGVGVLINGLAPNASAPVSTGILIAPTYPYSSLQTMESLIQQLTSLGWMTGFDIRFNVAYSNGPRSPLIATIDISYPRSGRYPSSESGLVVDVNRARNYKVSENFKQTGSVQYEQGVPGQLYVVDNTAPREQGWPLTEQVQSRSTVAGPQAPALLKAIGEGDSYLYSYPVTTIVVTMPLWGDDPQIGTFITGDDARMLYNPVVVGQARGNGDYNFPAGLDQDMRIVGWEINAPDEGDATIDLTLNLPPAATASSSPIATDGPLNPIPAHLS